MLKSIKLFLFLFFLFVLFSCTSNQAQQGAEDYANSATTEEVAEDQTALEKLLELEKND